jgi:RsiW-degrading membrane proteinase PrsW (M82 family)
VFTLFYIVFIAFLVSVAAVLYCMEKDFYPTDDWINRTWDRRLVALLLVPACIVWGIFDALSAPRMISALLQEYLDEVRELASYALSK